MMNNELDYNACEFSPNGLFVAAALGNSLLIKKTPFIGVHVVAKASHKVENIQWNSRSNCVLCSQFENDTLQVYNLRATKWSHTITSGYFKFIAAIWMGHRKILLTLEYHMALAVFDMSTNNVYYIEVPKPIRPCIVFNSDGNRMCVVSKINGYEKLLIINSKSLDKIIYLQDLIGLCNGLRISPDCQFLCVFNRQKIAIINFQSGDIIGEIQYLSSINTVCWAPNGEYLALGCSNGIVVILDKANDFNVTFKLNHCPVNKCLDFYKEINGVLIKKAPTYNFVNATQKNIASIAWSFCCNYTSTYEEESNFLYIWQQKQLICVVEFSSAVEKVCWCLTENKLSAVFGTDSVFIWTNHQCPRLEQLPKLSTGNRMSAMTISWSCNNKDMILSNREKFLIFSV